MQLNHLTLLNYRGIEQADLDFSHKLNAFVGSNGMGKTNLLDAIYHLSFCKGALSVSDAHNMRHGADFFMLEGKYEKPDGERMDVSCSLRTGGRKRLKVDAKPCRRFSEHIGKIPLVMLSPGDVQLISGSGEERRRFMDSVIAQHDPVYLAAAIRYEKTRTQRNALLGGDAVPDWGVLDVLDEMLAADGQTICRKRKDFTDRFFPLFAGLYPALCPDEEEAQSVSIAYEPSCPPGEYRDRLRSSREKERIVGHTLYGPHRDDLVLNLGGYSVRREASQGQTKTWTIAMKLAQYLYLREMGKETTPILLLDDMFDKLDADRVARIVSYVSGDTFGQIFITDTNREHLDHILEEARRDYRIFTVDRGVVNLSQEG